MAESVGLCAHCTFASPQAGVRGSRFWRCRRADADPAFPRYPALPVLRGPIWWTTPDRAEAVRGEDSAARDHLARRQRRSPG